MPGDQARHDHGHHARRLGLLGGQERQERHDEADRGHEDRVVQLAPQPDGRAAHDVADEDGERDRADEVEDRVAQAESRGDGQQCRPQHDQGGGVVEQALALQHRHQAVGEPEALADRGGCDRVRGADDGAQCHAGREGDVGNDEVHDGADGERGDDDQGDREPRDHADAPAQVDDGHLHRGGVQQRRQGSEEDPVGLQLEVGRAGHEAEGDAEDQQDQGSGDPGAPGQHRRHDDRHQGGDGEGQQLHVRQGSERQTPSGGAAWLLVARAVAELVDHEEVVAHLTGTERCPADHVAGDHAGGHLQQHDEGEDARPPPGRAGAARPRSSPAPCRGPAASSPRASWSAGRAGGPRRSRR